MAKPTPSLANSVMKDRLRQIATPATHAEAPIETAPSAAPKGKAKTQLIGVHLLPEVGKQLRQIALDEDTDVKALLIEAINTLFKSRGKPQIASDPIER